MPHARTPKTQVETRNISGAGDARYYKAPDYRDGTHAWLARARRWDIEYKGYLSNHLTHNWVVMGALGEPDTSFAWWENLYANMLDAKPAREPGDLEPPRQFPGDEYTQINRVNWRNNIQSTRVAFPAFRDFFDAELADKGLSETLRTYLPALLPGLAGAALHAVIHTGWAADIQSENMLGEGLAYMATSFQPLGTTAPHQPPATLWTTDGQSVIEATLAYLSAETARSFTKAANEASQTETYTAINRGGFQHRILAFNDPELELAESLNSIGPVKLPPVGQSLTPAIEDLTALTAAALLASDNEFFILHGLTSLHGVLSLIPHLDAKDQRDALIYWWRALLATLIVQDRPGIDGTVELLRQWTTEKEIAPDAPRLAAKTDRWWRSLVKAVLSSRDEHVPKAVYVLWRWSAWEAFSAPTVSLFERAALNIAEPQDGEDVHENLWFAKSFSEASAQRERMYD